MRRRRWRWPAPSAARWHPLLHGLREYAGEPHRVQLVTTVDGVEAYDDSKGTNVGATVAALDGLGADKAPARLVVILGGDGKGQDFTPLTDMRASAEYRLQVARNLLQRFWLETRAGNPLPASATSVFSVMPHATAVGATA